MRLDSPSEERMKPWEETWEQTEPRCVLLANGTWCARFSPAPGISPDHEAGRAKLAAAAPEMARALLALYMGQEVSISVIIEALRAAGVILSFEEEVALLERGEALPRGPRP